MKRIHHIIFTALCLLMLSVPAFSKADKTPQQVYIERYSSLAVEEMYRSGVPASITLAQGLLESRYGLSELAVEGNNHFGIKCHNWAGHKIFHDDDKKAECFRKYASAEDSFRDHSDFLRFRDRYKFLFDLEVTDYKGWAHGLKKAGYATDSSYPSKLIRLIEEYRLYEYDTKPASWTADEAEGDAAADKPDRKVERKKRKDAKKADRKERKLPEPPSQIEKVSMWTGKNIEIFRFNLSRQMYSLNGVPFVYASEGETYEGIAQSYNLFLREILKYNDLTENEKLAPGTPVYLQKKKKQAAEGLDKHIVDAEGETLRDIAQRYAVRLDKLCKMNGYKKDHQLRMGEVVILR